MHDSVNSDHNESRIPLLSNKILDNIMQFENLGIKIVSCLVSQPHKRLFY